MYQATDELYNAIVDQSGLEKPVLKMVTICLNR